MDIIDSSDKLTVVTKKLFSPSKTFHQTKNPSTKSFYQEKCKKKKNHKEIVFTDFFFTKPFFHGKLCSPKKNFTKKTLFIKIILKNQPKKGPLTLLTKYFFSL